MTEELWKDIPGFEGVYEVSNLGRVRSLRFINNQVDKQRTVPLLLKNLQGNARSRYRSVQLSGRKKWAIHRLVLMAFVAPAPTPTHEAAHLDGNPENNTLGNLVWATSAENQGHKTLYAGKRNAPVVFSPEDLQTIRTARENGESFRSIARRYNVNPGKISDLFPKTSDAQEIAALNEKIAALDAALHQKGEMVLDYMHRVDGLHLQIDQLRAIGPQADWQAACVACRQRITELEAALTDARQQIAKLRIEFEHKVEEIDRLNQIIRRLMPEPV